MSFALAAAAAVCVLAALGPCVLFFRNLGELRPPPPLEPDVSGGPAAQGVQTLPESPLPAVSILIPARDEEAVIGEAVAAALASAGVEIEVVVLDDHSGDRTAAIVAAAAERDPRLRLASAPPMPLGWCGKQHACWALAGLARHPLLLFVDADVRLAPDGAARAAAFARASGAALVSGFPRQLTLSWCERLLIPLMHFVLLGFLPLAAMRRSHHPAYGAACGQLILAERGAYTATGGHAAIRASLHDGLALPRAFRRSGFATDLFDATGVAACRMYRSAGEVWRGLAKNAGEGIGAPGKIVPASLLLGAGQLLPPLALLLALAGMLPAWLLWPAAVATLAGYAPRLAAARRFRQPLDGALLHPLGIAAFLAVQWWALARTLSGRPATWKGRSYALTGNPGPDVEG